VSNPAAAVRRPHKAFALTIVEPAAGRTKEDEESTTVSPTPITEDELEQVERANATMATPVVFVHGLWLLPSSWEPWAALFEEAGYVALMPGWPDDPETVADAQAHPGVFAGKGIAEVADYEDGIIRRLDRKPVVVGHSFGGFMTEILAGRGAASRPPRSRSALRPFAGCCRSRSRRCARRA
jgi:pimeloyl-ACP methyl ester carboxylesterase